VAASEKANAAASPVAGREEGEYYPIPLDSLRISSVPAFDLYIPREGEGGDPRRRFTLYRRHNLPIRKDHLEHLSESGLADVYITAGERGKYQHYLEDHLGSMLRDEHIESEKRVHILYDAATGLLQDVWRDPSRPELQRRSAALVKNTFTCLLGQSDFVGHVVSAMSRQYSTYTHSVNVCLYSLALAKHLGLGVAAVEELGLGTFLHDVGKINVPERILEKKGSLTLEEMRVVMKHPEQGVAILQKVAPLDEGVYHIVLQHHEKCDGSGYPQRLREGSIHLYAKIACLIDVFDALTSDRPYKAGCPADEAFKLMRDEMAGCFDRDLWREFATVLAVDDGE